MVANENGNKILGENTKTYSKTTGIDEGIRNFPINEKINEIIDEQTGKKITNIYRLLFLDCEKILL